MAESPQNKLDKIALKIPIWDDVIKEPPNSSPRLSRPLLGILGLALVVAVSLPLINITVIFPAYTKMLLASLEGGTELLAAHTIPLSAKFEGLSHESMDSPRLLAEIYRLEKDFGLLKLALYSPQGVSLYSSDASEVNSINKDPRFHRIVAKGKTLSELITASKPGPDGTVVHIDVAKTSVPLMRNGDFLGAFEFQFDISDIKKQLDRFNTYATYGSIIASLCILFGVIVLLKKESSRLAALRQAEQLRTDVDQITRHDLKSPLVGALNGINYLKQFTKTDPEQEEVLEEMHKSAIAGLDLINRSLDIYKMETGKYKYHPTPVDIAATCRRVATDLSGLAAARRVTINIQRDDQVENALTPLEASGEETLCYSLFANLVKNGVEASPPDKEVGILLSSNSHATIS